MILAGDIGGTHSRLALFEAKGEPLKLVVEQTFSSRERGGLDEIIRDFLREHDVKVERACFGVAGPVSKGVSKTSNLPWVVDAAALAELLGIAGVGLINDLEANAYGLAELGAEDFAVIKEGTQDIEGNAAVISAGTGLGEAGLHFEGQKRRPVTSEGGHVDFAPRSELEIELLRYLLAKYDHVSYERVLSGPGLLNIYEFLRDTGRGEEPAWLVEKMRSLDPSAVIAQAALDQKSELCAQALEMFVSIYGAEAGNLALKVMATGGVFVGGGIAPKVIKKLKDKVFVEAFTAKGRMKPLLEAIPVRVIMNDCTGLLGAAHWCSI